MSAVKKESPTLHVVPSLEMLASKLSVGGGGDYAYFDKPPQQPGQIRTADLAMCLADISDPLQWMLFWFRYMLCLTAKEQFLLWTDKELKARKVNPDHIGVLSQFAASAYCHGKQLSANRIAKKLKVGRNDKAARYVDTLSSILYVASQSEQALGKEVRKRMK